jgi:tRNA (cytidine32/uridine32-2'-O)-methyltransferase
LNLAAAVQVLCYEIRLAFLNQHPASQTLSKQDELASINDIEQFYQHLQTLMTDLGFIKKENPALMPKVRRLFNRVRLEKNEVHILRGMLTAVQKRKKSSEFSSSN